MQKSEHLIQIRRTKKADVILRHMCYDAFRRSLVSSERKNCTRYKVVRSFDKVQMGWTDGLGDKNIQSLSLDVVRVQFENYQ